MVLPSPSTVFLSSFIAFLAETWADMDHNFSASLIPVTTLMRVETVLLVDSGTNTVDVLNAYFGDDIVFKIHTPSSMFLACLIVPNPGLNKGVSGVDKTESLLAMLGLS